MLHEATISNLFDKPVFVHHDPTEMKAFYMERGPGPAGDLPEADLLAPEGYGEMIGGGPDSSVAVRYGLDEDEPAAS